MTGFLTVRRADNAVVTDLGRANLARLGIPSNGAADQYSATVANILVGNPAGAPLLETTASDLVVRPSRPALVAVTGATADLTVDGAPHPTWQPVCVAAGQRVAITAVRDGLRAYLAIHGSLEVPRVLGSCAPDPLLHIGTPLGRAASLRFTSDYQPVDHPFGQPLFRAGARKQRCAADTWSLDVVAGPDSAEFPDAASVLTSATYTVSPHSDHIGVRLEGPAPKRDRDTEIASRGVPLGAVEVPPTGELLVLRRGRPVTAGYPVVAVVTRQSNSRLGQVRPGQRVRLRYRSIAEAIAAYRTERQHLRDLTRRVHTMFSRLGIPTNDTARTTHEQPAH